MSYLVFLKKICYGIELIVAIAGKFAAYMVPFLALTVAFEVFSRYFLGSPTVWAHELSLFFFGYIAALGGAYAHQKRAHITVDIFYINCSAKMKSLFNIISYCLGIFFLVVIVSKSAEKLIEAIDFNYRTQEWGAPMHHFWGMCIVASILFILQMIKDFVCDIYFLVTGNKLMGESDNATADNEGLIHGN